MDTRKKLKNTDFLKIIKETGHIDSESFKEVEKHGMKLESHRNRSQVMDKCEFEVSKINVILQF